MCKQNWFQRRRAKAKQLGKQDELENDISLASATAGREFEKSVPLPPVCKIYIHYI
jgi:hypothetical protein